MSNYLLLFILLGSTNAAPQPDAAPNPEPDADAYGDNYGAPVISSNTSPVIDSGVGGGRLVTAKIHIDVRDNKHLINILVIFIYFN